MNPGRKLIVEEIGSDQCASLDAAFVAALPSVASLLAARIRLGLDNGRYANTGRSAGREGAICGQRETGDSLELTPATGQV